MSIGDIIKQIEATNKRTEKEQILADNAEALFDFFRLALDSELMWGVKKIPLFQKASGTLTLSQGFEILENEIFKHRGDDRIDFVRKLIESLSREDQDILIRVIKKSPDCGVSLKTANKVFKKTLNKTIREFDVMLCKQFGKHTINFPAFVQEKLDGMRVIVTVRQQGVTFRSRNGKFFDPLEQHEIVRDLLALVDKYGEFILDGEMLVEQMDRKAGNGALNSIRQGKNFKDVNKVKFTFFDFVNYNEFVEETETESYNTRWNTVQEIVSVLPSHYISIPKTIIADNERGVFQFYQSIVSQGGEGVVVKSPDGKYQRKRVSHQLKLKVEKTCDLEIVDIIEGDGKFAGTAGALVCRDSTGRLNVNVGSGMTESVRDFIWENRNVVKGKIVEVKYNEKIENKDGGVSLFLPVFVKLRNDKDIADSIDVI